MDKVKDYILHASTQLNDQLFGRAFVRWGRGLLLDYLNLGLAEIGAYRPDAFAAEEEITLSPGAKQTLAGGRSLKSLVANVDGSFIRESDAMLLKSFAAYDVCAPNIRFKDGRPDFKIRSFAVSKDNPATFYVEPPVPKGLEVRVIASILGETPVYTLDDWSNEVLIEAKYKNSLVDFMLGKAYEANKESAGDRIASQQHFARFYQILGVKYKRESQYRSGNDLGKTGSGDERVRG